LGPVASGTRPDPRLSMREGKGAQPIRIASPTAPPAARRPLVRRPRCAQALCGALAMLLMTGERPDIAAEVVGDALPRALTGSPGDATRGRQLVFARDRGNCIACHVIPVPDEVSHGNLGPSLRGVADRLDAGQIRLRLVDVRRIAPASIMPAYYRVDGLKRVAAALRRKPVLAAQEIEDVLAFLMTLHEQDKR
jgi:L-cysteine S-thiosulfotransferase